MVGEMPIQITIHAGHLTTQLLKGFFRNQGCRPITTINDDTNIFSTAQSTNRSFKNAKYSEIIGCSTTVPAPVENCSLSKISFRQLDIFAIQGVFSYAHLESIIFSGIMTSR